MSWCPELTSLRLLVDVQSSGSITEAARLAGVSQPAASKRIRALEGSMAIPLIERRTTGSRLTAHGQVVAEWAERVFDAIDAMLDAVESMRSDIAPDLRIAASMTIAEHLVPNWLAALRAAVNNLHVGLEVTNSTEVQQLVLRGDVDLGLVETGTIDPRLRSAVISHDRLVVVVPPSHPWAKQREPLRVEELAASQLAVREQGSGTRETLDRWIAAHNPDKPLVELGSNAAVKGAVRAGLAPAVLSILTVEEELATGQLVEVHVADIDLSRPLQVVWRRGEPLEGAAKVIIEVARRRGLRR